MAIRPSLAYLSWLISAISGASTDGLVLWFPSEVNVILSEIKDQRNIYEDDPRNVLGENESQKRETWTSNIAKSRPVCGVILPISLM